MLTGPPPKFHGTRDILKARPIAAYDCQDVRHAHAQCSGPFLSRAERHWHLAGQP